MVLGEMGRRQGVALAEPRAAATLWTLNRRHLAADAIEALARLPEVVVEQIRAAVRGWRVAPLHASLFGSVVAGTADEESDLDLFIVAPTRPGPGWDDQLVNLQDDVRSMTGNDLSLLEWSARELHANRTTPLVRSIAASHVHVAGTRLGELVTRPA